MIAFDITTHITFHTVNGAGEIVGTLAKSYLSIYVTEIQ